MTSQRPSDHVDLTFDSIECIPIVHGRLAFALEVRRRLLEKRYAAVAVELPETLADPVREAVRQLPRISVVTYRDQPGFVDEQGTIYYVPVQPADGVIEAIRINERERTPCYFVDADIDDCESKPVMLPDPNTLHTLGMQTYYDTCLAVIARHRRSPQDALREGHMAARLRAIQKRHEGPILFVCGMAHWQPIREHLVQGSGTEHAGHGYHEELKTFTPDSRSVPHLVGELPFLVGRYEEYRAGFEVDDFDVVLALRELLLRAREHHEQEVLGSLERPDPNSLRTLLDYARKMTVRKGQLIPDMYTLTVAAHGVVGNDYAISVLKTANHYPWAPVLTDGSDEADGEGPEEFGPTFGDGDEQESGGG